MLYCFMWLKYPRNSIIFQDFAQWMTARIVNNNIAAYWTESDIATIISSDTTATVSGVLFEIGFEQLREDSADFETQ